MTPDLHLAWCDTAAARYAVTHWHYSGTLPPPPRVCVGVWEAGRFIGCVLFSRGANKNLGRPYGLAPAEICELTRVALARHTTPTSRIVRIAVRLLARLAPGVRLIVSYADPNVGHHGGLYQALGWMYDGTTAADFYLRDHAGRRWHSRQVSVTGMKRQYGTLRRVRRPQDGTVVPLQGKHRYLYALDTTLRPTLLARAHPYPRRVGSIDSDAPPALGGEGGARPTPTLPPPA